MPIFLKRKESPLCYHQIMGKIQEKAGEKIAIIRDIRSIFVQAAGIWKANDNDSLNSIRSVLVAPINMLSGRNPATGANEKRTIGLLYLTSNRFGKKSVFNWKGGGGCPYDEVSAELAAALADVLGVFYSVLIGNIQSDNNANLSWSCEKSKNMLASIEMLFESNTTGFNTPDLLPELKGIAEAIFDMHDTCNERLTIKENEIIYALEDLLPYVYSVAQEAKNSQEHGQGTMANDKLSNVLDVTVGKLKAEMEGSEYLQFFSHWAVPAENENTEQNSDCL